LSNDFIELAIQNSEFISAVSPQLLIRTLWALSALGSSQATGEFERSSLQKLFTDGENLSFDISIPEVIIILNSNFSLNVLPSKTFEIFMEKILITVQTESIGPTMYGSIGESVLNIAERLSNHSVSDNGKNDISRVRALMDSCIEAMIEKSCKQLKKLTVHTLTTILRLAVYAHSASTTHLLNLSLRYFDNLFSRNESISAPEAVHLLEVLASAAVIERNARDALSIHVKDLLNLPGWHRIVGRLSTICAASPDILSRQNLIDAIWSVAVFNHPFRLLLRAVRKSVQFCLHELSPRALCKLAVAVAVEEVSGSRGLFIGERSAKLDRDFVDQVAVSTLRAINDMPTLEEQIDGIVAVAQMGRISGMGSVDDKSTGGPLFVDSGSLTRLRTSRLVKLNWAFGRLPACVPSQELLESVRDEIQERFTTEMDNPEFLGDCIVYISSLASTHSGAMDASLLPRAEGACSAIVTAWGTVGKGYDISLDGQHEHEKGHSTLSRAASTLCEAFQSFIELKWFDINALNYCESWLKHQPRHIFPSSSGTSQTKCYEEYMLGRLEEYISMYRPLVDNEMQHPRVRFGKKIFSKFLHGFFRGGNEAARS